MSPNIKCTWAVHWARHLHFMSYVVVFTFYDFHHVKLPSLGNREDSWLNICLCIFPAWDCMEEERNHPTNYLPTDIFPWASPGGVGDQQAAPGGLIDHVLRSVAAAASVRRVHSFLNVIFIPPTSCAFIYCSICRLLHYSLCCHLDADLQMRAISELCAHDHGVLAQKRLFNDQNASHLTPPHLFTSWLAHVWHSWYPTIPPVSILFPRMCFFQSMHLSPKQLTTFAGSEAAVRCRLHDTSHHGCSPSP